MFLRALRGYEKWHRPDHTPIVYAAYNLASVYHRQGKLVNTEQSYLRALEGLENIRGSDHPSSLPTVSNLAWVFAGQDKSQEAERLILQATRINEQAGEPTSSETLSLVDISGDYALGSTV